MQPDKSTFEIGIIGAGDMGLLYAQRFRKAGWKRINICDIPARYQELREQLADQDYQVLPDGYAVSRRSDYIIYSVEAGNIDSAVAQYGRATKVGAIVGGQTSVKAPEIAAFERHLPADVHIVTLHSLHGPNIDTPGQPLVRFTLPLIGGALQNTARDVVIRHRCDDQRFESAKAVLNSLKSNMVHLSYTEHDR
ncbi:prephenate dehydrogenase (NADP(+)) [Dimargaris verticillata]|uniref:Prephenate dehydrogenase (NADP(+)) n=1 Tax=Dimargaris verticillata TaxID=2761393 RepID=A0A9W8EAH9_9FUNG|nr:prephenate dehydrogenase (NADP(+)) [Dimargaris verticillata]